MLSLFPGLFAFSFFAPLILRIAAGAPLILSGIARLGKDRGESALSLGKIGLPAFSAVLLAVAEIAAGTFLLAGLFTQAAAGAGIVLALFLAALARRGSTAAPLGPAFYALLSVVCASLLLTGPGAFAFDLPL